ncbi:MAG: ABC transporter ATP-binding protein [Clostridiales bacterium]|nr:ABC transporter ATP-binding protein [Clostridiales bacterium]
MIKFENFSFTYPDAPAPALKNINLEIQKGAFLGIIGPSGAGKSTLTYAINGAIPHYYQGVCQGQVMVDGIDVFDSTPETISLKVGSVFGDVESFFVASVVEEEILFGLENFNIPRSEIEGRITSALDAVGISELRYRSISSLSGGQKQKVAISAAIALRPQILLLDEPTSELDPQSSRQIFSLLRTLNKSNGMTIVVVEQKIMLLCEYVDRLTVINDGEIYSTGSVRDVLSTPSKLEKIGVNCPRVTTLSSKLAAAGLTNEPVALNLNEAESMVRRIIRDYIR